MPARRASAALDCLDFDPGNRASVEATAVIVIGTVASGGPAGSVVIHPEAYLRGAAERKAFMLSRPPSTNAVQEAALRECPPAILEPGSRVLLALYGEGGELAWPGRWQAFTLRDGTAANQAPGEPLLMAEDELIEEIRAITGVYVVPAESDPAFSIQWTNLAIVAGALAIVFAIGLALMRVWHRIDPT